jgi:membrane protein
VTAAGSDEPGGLRRTALAVVAAKVWLLRIAYRSRFGTLLRRMSAVGGLSRASTLAGNAFVAIVPLLIVVASWTETSDRRHISDALVVHFGLTGGAAEAVQQLFARPPDAAEGVTVFGMLLILISAASFARTVQRIYELAWGVPACGARGALEGVGGAIVLAISMVAVSWIGETVWRATDTVLVAVPLQAVLAAPVWTIFIWLALSRRRPLNYIWPGALISAGGQAIVSLVTSSYVPHLITGNSLRYGVIGVAFAIISWLVIVGYLVVGSAVIGAELGVRVERRTSAGSSERPDERDQPECDDRPPAEDRQP